MANSSGLLHPALANCRPGSPPPPTPERAQAGGPSPGDHYIQDRHSHGAGVGIGFPAQKDSTTFMSLPRVTTCQHILGSNDPFLLGVRPLQHECARRVQTGLSSGSQGSGRLMHGRAALSGSPHSAETPAPGSWGPACPPLGKAGARKVKYGSKQSTCTLLTLGTAGVTKDLSPFPRVDLNFSGCGPTRGSTVPTKAKGT